MPRAMFPEPITVAFMHNLLYVRQRLSIIRCQINVCRIG